MNSKDTNEIARSAAQTVNRIASAVSERGFDDVRRDLDDYSQLLATFECRKAITFQLYDNYFPPQRHEFELQILTTIVDAIAQNFQAAAIGAAVASGIVGGIAYDLLKKVFAESFERLKPIKRTHIAMKEIEKNADAVVEFFKRKKQAEIVEIANAVGTSPEKVEPILKLLGFQCQRKGKRRIWAPPSKIKLKKLK